MSARRKFARRARPVPQPPMSDAKRDVVAAGRKAGKTIAMREWRAHGKTVQIEHERTEWIGATYLDNFAEQARRAAEMSPLFVDAVEVRAGQVLAMLEHAEGLTAADLQRMTTEQKGAAYHRALEVLLSGGHIGARLCECPVCVPSTTEARLREDRLTDGLSFQDVTTGERVAPERMRYHDGVFTVNEDPKQLEWSGARITIGGKTIGPVESIEYDGVRHLVRRSP